MNALRALWTALWTDNAPEMRLAPPTAIAGPRCPCGAPGVVPVRAGFDNYTVCEAHAPQPVTV